MELDDSVLTQLGLTDNVFLRELRNQIDLVADEAADNVDDEDGEDDDELTPE